MKLQRLRISQLRQFQQPFEIADFNAGLNLFTGPNESGKSTLVRALRAAFFERYRSSAVADLQPWADSSAAPSIELDFEIQGRAYRLRKSFLQRKRCELHIDGRKLENDDAETHLAKLFGFEFAAKGASKPEHWGIPGLLWIAQGSGHEIHAAVGHATDHLRNALTASLGEVTSTAGDDVLAQVRTEHDKLLTSTGRPRLLYAELIAQREALRTEVLALEAKTDAYRAAVDRLGAVQQEITSDELERPWATLEAQTQQAEAALAGVRRTLQQIEADQALLAQLDQQLALLQAQAERDAALAQQLDQRRLACQQAEAAAQAAADALAPAQQRLTLASAEHGQAQAVLALARQEGLRQSLLQQSADWQQRSGQLQQALAQARAQSDRLVDLRKTVATTTIAAADLKALRSQVETLRELHIRQQAVATRVRYALAPGQAITVDGERLQGEGERLLLQPALWLIPQVGQLTITPGGDDLAGLATRSSDLAAAQQALLRRLGLANPGEAELKQQRHQDAKQALQGQQALFDQGAPAGLEALAAETATLLQRLADVTAQLTLLPPPPAGPVLTLAPAERSLKSAGDALTQARDSLQLAQATQLRARADADHQQAELARLAQQLSAPETQQALAQHQQSLQQVLGQRAALQLSIGQRQHELQALQPQLLQQDADRLRRSAQQSAQAYAQRKDERLKLQARLEEAGTQGLEELLAEARAAQLRLDRRQAELGRRAGALALLVRLMEERRQAVIQRLQAPLQTRLNHYLPLLFAASRIELDEHLAPGPLWRPGVLTTGSSTSGGEAAPFDALSFGAREQMALISRLAYADLLQQAGRPTLIILDDALVHSDAARLQSMKRMLFDAATRHQILLFSCHPEAWRDLGVAPRAIDAMRAAQPA